MSKFIPGSLENDGFAVLVMNGKGGVGKSNICFHLAHNFAFTGMDFDVKGNLSVRLPKRFHHIDVNTSLDDIYIPKDENVIIDMGGNDDYREVELAESVNLIVIPYTPTIESVMTTLATLERIKHLSTPILFVATRVTNKMDATTDFYEQVEALREAIGNKDVSHYVLKERVDYQRVTEDDTPIMELLGSELDKNGNPSPMHFRARRAMNTKRELNGLHDLILEYK